MSIDATKDEKTASSLLDDVVFGASENATNYKLVSVEKKRISDCYGISHRYFCEIEKNTYESISTTFIVGKNVYSVAVAFPEKLSDEILEKYSHTIDSITVIDSAKYSPSQPTADSSISQQEETSSNAAESKETSSSTDVEGESLSSSIKPNNTPSASLGQRNALEKAKSYLRSSAFSYQGLVGQLEYNKFSIEDATYAADNCGADWNEQALKKAKSYIGSSAFSYEGLIGQLEYNKFTNEQAKYGADNCATDWNEQAAKKAASYLQSSSFSRDGLIGQLEYNGFTHEQAVYGADSVGY